MALIITRRVSQRVMIGEHIVVMIAGVKGNHVRLSIEAPLDVKILREELIGTPPKDEDYDPTPWCNACGAPRQADCHCGPIADNE